MHGVRPAEQPLIDRLREMANQAADEYRPVLTSFLNPRQRVLAEMVGAKAGVTVHGNGGFTNAEMQRVLFAPDYFVPEASDYAVTVLECQYPAKFTTLHHSTILGSMVHHGLDRSAFGDIITQDGRWQLAVSAPLADFIAMNVTQIGKTKVQWQAVSAADILRVHVPFRDLVTVVSAIRVDAIVAAGFNLARSQVKELVSSGDIQINWLSERRGDAQLVPGDMVSVRGHGRVQLVDILGITAKDRWRVALKVLVK